MEMNNRIGDEAEEAAAACQGSGKSAGIENVKNVMNDELHHFSDTPGEEEEDMDGRSGTAHCIKQASEWLGHSAEYIRQFDLTKADAGVREYVRQSPGRSLLIAGAVGLIIGFILRRR
jgi:ElaB/YqjD/DUF883 family membrane-anchored ribosome-binding protein